MPTVAARERSNMSTSTQLSKIGTHRELPEAPACRQKTTRWDSASPSPALPGHLRTTLGQVRPWPGPLWAVPGRSRGVAAHGVGGEQVISCPGSRGRGEPGRPPDESGPREEVRRGGGGRETAAAGGAAAERSGPEQGRTRGHGKNFRALGNDLRERGLEHAVDPVVDTAVTGVEDQLGIAAACRLTGRSRATHYRRLRPSPERKPRKPRAQP